MGLLSVYTVIHYKYIDIHVGRERSGQFALFSSVDFEEDEEEEEGGGNGGSRSPCT